MRPMRGKIRSIWICMLLCLSIFFVIDISFDVVENVRAGTTLYVNTTGDGGAYTSIQDAINASSNGDMIIVYNGTYFENIVINKIISLIGEDKSNTTIQGSGSGDVLLITVNWVNVSGFQITQSGSGMDDAGLELNNVQNCSINSNIFSLNNRYGIYLLNSNKNNIIENNVSSNEIHGIILKDSNRNEIIYNDVSNNYDGIKVEDSDNNNLSENVISSNENNGISLYRSNQNNIWNNNVSNHPWYGIKITKSIKNNISNNIASSNKYYGILLSESHESKVANNIVTNNQLNGIGLIDAQKNSVLNNTMINTGLIIHGDQIEYWITHDINSLNTINGKPVFVFKNQTGGVVPPGAGQLILINCTSVIIENQDFEDSWLGILLAFTNESTISNNDLSFNDYGIYLRSSYFNLITENNVWNNEYGLYIVGSSWNNITENIAYNSEYGIYIGSADSNFLKNNVAYNSTNGIYLHACMYNNLTDNTVHNSSRGIAFYGSHYNNVTGGSYKNNSYGILIHYGSDYNDVFDGYISGNVKGVYISEVMGQSSRYNLISSLIENNIGAGIDISDSYNRVENSTIRYNSIGITMSGYNIVKNSIVQYNKNDGISATNHNTITDNVISYNEGYGLSLNYQNNTLERNTLFYNGRANLYIKYADNLPPYNTISDTNLVNGTPIIFFDQVDNITLKDIFATHITIFRSNNIILVNVTISNGDMLHLYEASNVTIKNCKFIDSYKGIEARYVDNISLLSSTFSNNRDDGIEYYYVTPGTLTECEISNNSMTGMQMYMSPQFYFSNVNFWYNEYDLYVFGSDIEDYNNSIDTSNKVNGKPLYYIFKSSNQTYDNLDTYFINVIDGYNVTVKNIIMDRGSLIQLTFSNESKIENCIMNNTNGLWLYDSHDCYVRNCVVTNSSYGICVYSSYRNDITNNYFQNNIDGIYIGYSSSNEFYENNIINNTNGLYTSQFSYPNIYVHNNFIDNEYQAYVQSYAGKFYDIYPNGGNYWSDYNGSDNQSGENQDQLGSDGIGDTPYKTKELWGYYGYDKYPLMKPYNVSFLLSVILNSTDLLSSNGTLDFWVLNRTETYVNYSINDGPEIPFSHPHNISLSGWDDGNYKITIKLRDNEGNTNIEDFFIAVDSTPPDIALFSPINSSKIQSGTILNFSITDDHFDFVEYIINNGTPLLFNYPFNINTSNWLDGDYTIQINTYDLVGNSNSSWYYFIVDNFPLIILNAPLNNSIISSGTVLNFSIISSNLNQLNYSINGGSTITFSDPFDISTTGWKDGNYSIQINALDLVGNLNSSAFFFIFDSTKPDIILESPNNNSCILIGIIIEFTINDTHLLNVNYSINVEETFSASNKFNFSTEQWTEGNYTVLINALDLAGNTNSKWFFFTIDSIPPSIEFDLSLNHSTIPVGTTIQINISDENINKVMYSVDQGDYYLLTSPYIIDTTSWSDGAHTIYIKANDTAGNEIVRWFEIILDSIPPFVVSSQPQDQSENIEISTSIIITFSEQMNQADVEDYLTFSPSLDFTYRWEEDGTILNISFEPNNLAEGTTYSLEIDKQIKDLNGNPMISDFELEFTTKTSTPIPTPKSDEAEFPYWILAVVAIVAVVLILLFFLLTRRKGKEVEPKVGSEKGGPMVLEGLAEVSAGEEPEEGISWIQKEEVTPPEATPPVIAPTKPQPQVKCPRCNEMFAIDTSVVPYILNCPHCGLRGKVERKK